MSDNLKSALDAGYNIYANKLQNDIRLLGKEENEWTFARNAVLNSTEGDLGAISNEESNYLAAEIKYYQKETAKYKNSNIKIIGTIHIQNDEWAILSTDNINSEIGIFNSSIPEYKKIVNDKQFNFSTKHLVTGVARINNKCGRRIYWEDGYNPSRVLDLDDIPYKEDKSKTKVIDGCIIKKYTDKIDIEKTRLANLFKPIKLSMKRGQTAGQIINGTYFVMASYVIDEESVSPYSLPSNLVPIFVHENLSGSLDITIEQVDDENYDKIELIIVQYSNGSNVAKRLGTYSTRQKTITISAINPSLEDVQISSLIINHAIADKADAMYRNGDYIFRIGPSDKLDFNYQPLANQIKTKWVSIEYPAEYYRDGGTNVGYMRDEVYSFFIRWVYNTGDKSNAYHIPGRASKGSDMTISNDGIDRSLDEKYQPKWKFANTATVTYKDKSQFAPDGIGRIIAEGEMAYWESSELYEDSKPEIWNASYNPIFQQGWNDFNSRNSNDYDLCGKHIRHHKFPANDSDKGVDMVCNHYNPNTVSYTKNIISNGIVTGKEKVEYQPGECIRIMGVKFENIQPPVDNEGKIISNIVGYEILRGSRQGNKSILAKGIVNNMRQYNTINSKEQGITYLYPNYPYNALNGIGKINEPVDHFLSNSATRYSKRQNDYGAYLVDDEPIGLDCHFNDKNNLIGNVRKDYFTFHSPDTMFSNPFLSAKEMITYGTATGTMDGFFQVPDGQPKQRFITDTTFFTSILIGLGYGILKMTGKKTTSHTSPKIDYGGTKTDIGTSSGTTGLTGPSAASSVMQTVNKVASSMISDAIKSQTNGIIGMTSLATGEDPDKLTDAINKYVDDILSALGGNGGSTTETTEETEYKKIPPILRKMNSLPVFLQFWATGIDNTIESMYKWLPYRNYSLQQLSHGFYNGFSLNKESNRRRIIERSSYLDPTIHTFENKVKVNNLYRSRTVGIKLDKGIDFTETNLKDNSQALMSEVFNKSKSVWISKDEDDIEYPFTRNIASNYVALKQDYPNQYGKLEGIVMVPADNTVFDAPESFVNTASSEIIFGGDTYVNRYTEKNNMPFFYQWLDGEPNGTVFNYKMYKNVVHPRFWMNTDKFDVSDFVGGLSSLFGGNSASSSFDPYMIDPKYTEKTTVIIDKAGNYEEKENRYYDSKAKCDCEDTSKCYYKSSEVSSKVRKKFNNVCKRSEELEQAQIDYAYAQAWSCYYHKKIKAPVFKGGDEGREDYDNCEPCNNENSSIGEFLEEEYWSRRVSDWAKKKQKKFTDQKRLTRYNCRDKGKIKHLLKRFDKRVEKAQKKYDKSVDKLEKAYQNSLNGNNGNLFDRIKDKLVLPDDRYAFDQVSPQKALAYSVKNAYMYLFVSGVKDFFVESERNIDLRDWDEKPEQRHYDYKSYTNLRDMFATKIIKAQNHMKYDNCLSVIYNVSQQISWSQMQALDYDPLVSEKCYVYRPKRVIYSLPQEESSVKDTWRVFLPFNFRDYTSKVTAIKQFGKFGAIMLFESESPVFFEGVDQVSTDTGIKLNFGDGTVLSKYAQHLDSSDFAIEYGACQDRYSVVNTPFGIFYMSQNQGKIFSANASSGLMDISQVGMKWWFNKYLPYKLTKNKEVFTDYDYEFKNNPVYGIGCSAVYDSEGQKVIFSKKDYAIRRDIDETLKYIGNNKFIIQETGNKVKLGDERYFQDASWSISYDPTLKGGRFVSFHDWHPDMSLPCVDTFMTTKNNGIWKHNDNCHSYCNFYGVQYPFEVEFQINNESFNVETLSNVYYLMSCYVYAENDHDRFHVLDENFDEAVIYNSEQCSGLLHLNLNPKNDPIKQTEYPKVHYDFIDILFSKEEQMYKFNQFFDITDNRGEFSPDAQRTIWITSDNGYERELNQKNLNYSKDELQHKKFRHYVNNILLRKTDSNNKNIIMSMSLVKKINSHR